LLSRTHERGLRREWVHRLLDHDGLGGEGGGIERWLILTDALGLERDYVVSMQGALPATRFPGGGYLYFVCGRPPLVGVASSPTPDRSTRPAPPSRTHRRHARGLRLHRRRGRAILPPPAGAGQPRRRFRPRLRQASGQDAAGAGGSAGGGAL